MTPAQQTALEAVAGRALTPGEIVALEPLIADRNDVQIAAVISAGRVRIEPQRIGIGTILAVMAPTGGVFLDALEQLAAADSNVKWTLKLIEQSNFDIGHPVTRAQLAQFAAEHPPMAAGITALLAVAERPDPIHYNAISDALNVAEGRMTLGG